MFHKEIIFQSLKVFKKVFFLKFDLKKIYIFPHGKNKTKQLIKFIYVLP